MISAVASSRVGSLLILRGCARRHSMPCARSSSSEASSAPKPHVPVRREVPKAERAKLRAERKKRAAQAIEATQQTSTGASEGAAAGAKSGAAKTPYSGRVVYGIGVGVPTALLAWGIYDDSSPPAKLASAIGLTSQIKGVTDEFAKPPSTKLLPDWSQVSCLSLDWFVALSILRRRVQQ